MKFSPCNGDCTEEGSHCEGCGRTREEVNETRALVEDIARFAAKMGYDNINDFTQFVAKKATGKAMLMKMQQGQ
jgi:hypothetical protein